MKQLPAFRYFLYALGTVNVILAVVLFGASLAFNEGVNIVAMTVVVVVVNVVSLVTVANQFKGQR